MRIGVSALVMLAACGRFGFDATSDGGGGGSGSDGRSILIDALAPDGVAASSCTATRVADVMLASPVTNIIAAKTTGGYSLGFITGVSSFLSGVFVSDSLEPNTNAPHRTSPIPSFTFTYNRVSLFWTGTVLVGATSVVEDGNCYKKIYPTAMTLYEFADNGMQCRHGEPSVAKAGMTTLSTWWEGNEQRFATLADDGMPQNPEMSGGTVVGTISDSSIASGGTTAVLATALSGGTCQLWQLPTADGQNLPGTCAAPRIVNAGSANQWLVIYEDNANVTVLSATSVGVGPLIVTAPADLGTGQQPKLFLGTTGWLAAIATGTGLAIRDIDPVGDVAITGLPATPMSAFEVAEDAVFAAYGQDLYAITCK